jgi:hypothetical protein
MDEPPRTTRKPGRKPRKRLSRRDIQGLQYFHALDKLLGVLRRHKDCPNRLLHYDQLAMLVMLHFFNPVISGLRSLQQASALGNVQEKLGVSRASLGSLSEASRVFDPKLLAGVAAELAGRVAAADAPARPDDLPQGLDALAVDGSLLQAVARMVWAVWLDPEHRAAKLHLEFNVLRATPGEARVTDGNGSEKKVLREILRPGALYLLDAGYGEYALLEEICAQPSSCSVTLQLMRGTVRMRPSCIMLPSTVTYQLNCNRALVRGAAARQCRLGDAERAPGDGGRSRRRRGVGSGGVAGQQAHAWRPRRAGAAGPRSSRLAAARGIGPEARAGVE